MPQITLNHFLGTDAPTPPPTTTHPARLTLLRWRRRHFSAQVFVRHKSSPQEGRLPCRPGCFCPLEKLVCRDTVGRSHATLLFVDGCVCLPISADPLQLLRSCSLASGITNSRRRGRVGACRTRGPCSDAKTGQRTLTAHLSPKAAPQGRGPYSQVLVALGTSLRAMGPSLS